MCVSTKKSFYFCCQKAWGISLGSKEEWDGKQSLTRSHRVHHLLPAQVCVRSMKSWSAGACVALHPPNCLSGCVLSLINRCPGDSAFKGFHVGVDMDADIGIYALTSLWSKHLAAEKMFWSHVLPKLNVNITCPWDVWQQCEKMACCFSSFFSFSSFFNYLDLVKL